MVTVWAQKVHKAQPVGYVMISGGRLGLSNNGNCFGSSNLFFLPCFLAIILNGSNILHAPNRVAPGIY